MDVYAYSAETSILFPNTNDGDDELRDTDGRGVLRYTFTGSGTSATTSRVIGGAALELNATQWQSPDGKFTYTQQGSDLLVTINGDAEGSITIRDFDFAKAANGGYLGIRLLETPAAPLPQELARTFFGDKEDWDSDPVEEGIQTQVDAFGNVIRADGQEGRPDTVQVNRADTFYGSAADEVERFQTGGGDDVVYGDGPSSFTSSSGGRDLIETGGGRDIVTAGAGNDWIEGGEDRDILAGNLGDDVILAHTLEGGPLNLAQVIAAGEGGANIPGFGDLLTGDAGKDILIGDITADLLAGGEDADILIGGQGNDTIYGDRSVSAAELGWTITRTATTTNGVKNYLVDSATVTFAGDPSVGGADVVYGGGGKDWIFGGAGDDYLKWGRSARKQWRVVGTRIGSGLLVARPPSWGHCSNQTRYR